MEKSCNKKYIVQSWNQFFLRNIFRCSLQPHCLKKLRKTLILKAWQSMCPFPFFRILEYFALVDQLIHNDAINRKILKHFKICPSGKMLFLLLQNFFKTQHFGNLAIFDLVCSSSKVRTHDFALNVTIYCPIVLILDFQIVEPWRVSKIRWIPGHTTTFCWIYYYYR